MERNRINTFKVCVALVVMGLILPQTAGAVDAGLVGYWNFDEGFGTTAADSSGNGYNGILINSPSWAGGRIGPSALKFVGTAADDYVRIPRNAALGLGTTDFSICFWMKATAGNAAVLGMGVGTGYQIYLRNDTTVRLDLNDHNNLVQGFLVPGRNPADGTWHHVCFTVARNSATGIKGYWDGNLVSTNSDTAIGTNSIYDGSTDLGIGTEWIKVSDYAGSLDEVRIYNLALSAQEISNIYTAPRGNADIVPPVISSVSATSTVSTAVISFLTNEPSDTQVDYGTSPAYGSQTPLNPALLTLHSVTLANLSPDTTYYYRVKSNDDAGNLAVVENQTFRTAVPVLDVTPPVISNAAASSIGSSTADISWQTDEPTRGQVEFVSACPSSSCLTPITIPLSTGNFVHIANLSPSTTYAYRIKSSDAAGNPAVSGNFTLTTSAYTPPPIIPGNSYQGQWGRAVPIADNNHPNLYYNQSEISELRNMVLVQHYPQDLYDKYMSQVRDVMAIETDPDMPGSPQYSPQPINMIAALSYMIEPTEAKAEAIKRSLNSFLQRFSHGLGGWASSPGCYGCGYSVPWMFDLLMAYHPEKLSSAEIASFKNLFHLSALTFVADSHDPNAVSGPGTFPLPDEVHEGKAVNPMPNWYSRDMGPHAAVALMSGNQDDVDHWVDSGWPHDLFTFKGVTPTYPPVPANRYDLTTYLLAVYPSGANTDTYTREGFNILDHTWYTTDYTGSPGAYHFGEIGPAIIAAEMAFHNGMTGIYSLTDVPGTEPAILRSIKRAIESRTELDRRTGQSPVIGYSNQIFPGYRRYTDPVIEQAIPALSGQYTDTSELPSVVLEFLGYPRRIPPASTAITPSFPSVTLALSSGGSATASTMGTASTVVAGYATGTVNSGAAPFATAVFSFTQNGYIVSEAGIPAFPPTQNARIFIDYRTGVATSSGTLDIYTGLAIVNQGAGTASATYILRDRSGRTISTGHGILGAGAHQAKFLQELKDIAPDFNLPANFPTATLFGSLEITSSQPVSILALRLTANQRGDTLLTSTPVADMSQPLTTSAAYFPQLADGGGYVTSVILLNTSNATEAGTIALFDNDGAALNVRTIDGTSGSTFSYSIPPAGTFVFQTDGSPASAQGGWVRLTPNSGSTAPVGAGIFSYSQAGILITESGVPSAVPTTRARLYVDTSNGHDTGIAVANPGGSAGAVTLKTFQNDGTTGAGNGQTTLRLAANGHRSAYVGELISGLPAGFTGVAELTSASPFVALTLRSLVNGRGDSLLTTFPIADANQSAPSPIVFPHIASGGGYTTQFIFISASGGSSVNLNLDGDNGSPLSIAPN